MKVMKAALRRLWRLTRATSIVVGLAVMVALVAGVVSMAVAAPSGTTTATAVLKGITNTSNAVTTLVNSGTGAALALQVQPGNPPLTVNSETKVAKLNADKLDGLDSGAFLGANATATNADTLDNRDSTDFLAANGKAVDSSHADQATSATNAANADKLDSKDSTDFLAANGKAADSDKLDGKDSIEFAAASTGTAFVAQAPAGTPVHLTSGEFHDVQSKNLPTGSYVINAKTSFLNTDVDGDAFGGCFLITGNNVFGAGSQTYLAPNGKPGYQADLVTQGFLNNFGGGVIKLQCSYGDGQDPSLSQSANVDAYSSIITAIRVSSIQ